MNKYISYPFQMTYNATYLVGCGFAYCDDSRYEKYYVCNYAPGYLYYYLFLKPNNDNRPPQQQNQQRHQQQ